jgi:hypothetical protein
VSEDVTLSLRVKRSNLDALREGIYLDHLRLDRAIDGAYRLRVELQREAFERQGLSAAAEAVERPPAKRKRPKRSPTQPTQQRQDHRER